jgi:hypothetical protein
MNIDTQIRTAYEQGMTPAQIAEDQQLELVAVKAKLMQCCKKYRKDMGMEAAIEEDGLNFTTEELRDANKVIYETMLSAQDSEGNPDYKTRLNAAMYLRDDKRGRKEAKQLLQQNQFNIFDFNKAIESARSGAENVKRSLMGNGQGAIEV